jgi:hypothetical protein
MHLLSEALPSPAKEAIFMTITTQLSRPTVKAMWQRLQEAYRRDDVRLMWRIHAFLKYLVNGELVAVLSDQWRFTPACFYQWLTELVLRVVASLRHQVGGGRKAKLTPTQ